MLNQESIPGKDLDQYRYFIRKQSAERNREAENHRYYDGTYLGQWADTAIRQAVQDGIGLSTYNFTKKSVDVTAGSLMADPFELRYDTELGEDDIWAMILNEFYMRDKDILKYDKELWQFLRAGFIYRGYLQMYIDRQDPRGRIAIRYIHGDRIIQDPNRVTNDINDNEALYVHTWMTPKRIIEKYNKITPEIKSALEIWEKNQTNNGTVNDTSASGEDRKLFDTTTETYSERDGMFLVLDKHILEESMQYAVINMDTAEMMATAPYEDATLIAKTYELQGAQIKLLPKSVKRSMVRTTCPGLSLKLILGEGEYELKLGRYPFFEFSSDVINGKPNTYVDQIKGPNSQFNKRMNTATHILQNSVNNALMIEDDVHDDENYMRHIGKTRHRPGAYFIVRPGTIREKKIAHIDHGNPPTDALNYASVVLDIMKELTPAVPALQAESSANESGILYQSKLQQALVALQIPTRIIKTFWSEFGDAYMRAVKQVYVYPMLLKLSRSKELIPLNVPNGVDIATMPRMKVVVTQSPSSETNRKIILQSYLAIAQYMNDSYTLSELSRIVVSAIPGIPDEEREQLRKAAQLSSEAQEAALMAQIAQIKAQLSGGGAMPGQASPGQNQASPQGVDSQRLLENVIANVQNNKRGAVNAQGV